MQLTSFLKVTSTLGLITLLSACGFHLRDEYIVPEELHQLSFTSNDDYSYFSRQVVTQLKRNDINIVPISEKIPSLRIISTNMSSRTLSLYQNAQEAEKELTYKVQYSVTIPDIGIQKYTISVSRNYLENSLVALAKSVEKELIEQEMYDQAASQMMRQLGRVKAKYENEANDAAQSSD